MEQFQLSDVLLKKIADLISVKNNTQLKKIVKDIYYMILHDPYFSTP